MLCLPMRHICCGGANFETPSGVPKKICFPGGPNQGPLVTNLGHFFAIFIECQNGGFSKFQCAFLKGGSFVHTIQKMSAFHVQVLIFGPFSPVSHPQKWKIDKFSFFRIIFLMGGFLSCRFLLSKNSISSTLSVNFVYI